MHPILARPGLLAAYLAIWLPLGVLLAGLLAVQGVFTWLVAGAAAIPLSISYGFLCLSAWYVTGGGVAGTLKSLFAIRRESENVTVTVAGAGVPSTPETVYVNVSAIGTPMVWV